MYSQFILISTVEPFVLFPFTRNYLNLEMFKIFYLLGVYLKNVYFCMIFIFVFFFERLMQIPIKIPTGSIQDKEIECFTFIYLHDSWFMTIHSLAALRFWNKKRERLGFLPDFAISKRQRRRVEIRRRVRQPASAPSQSRMGKWFDSDFKGNKIFVLQKLGLRCKRKKTVYKHNYNC